MPCILQLNLLFLCSVAVLQILISLICPHKVRSLKLGPKLVAVL
ncbi:hypothetical protein E2C01_102229 [Portunus trituberculatus]|uniref:Uncharacterized protein n=1 Tax=Portunus trituberculatus TaxID=210409 RepID=A0A5B7KNQ3_PORTR|nr:hypothetical protein [Portunus trituberculatus]